MTFVLLLYIITSQVYCYPETAKNAFEYLDEQGFPYENHTIVTQDGYKLLLVRIPHNRNESSLNKTGPPILFVHGLLAQFFDFLVAGPGVAFGFKALEQGYDVFLLNTRGSRWSRSHVTLNPDKDANKFWNYSWHEIGIYDLTVTIDYIINITGYSKISYVGFSQGTTEFLVMASSKPEYNKKINIAVLLGPVAYLDHARNPLVILLKNNLQLFQEIIEKFNINAFLQYNFEFSQFSQLLCAPTSILFAFCKIFINDLTSGPSTQTNNSLISAFVTNNPAGASIKQKIHYIQNAQSGKFRRFDYGKNGNIERYRQPTPPDYNLSAIICPVALFYGASDNFVSIKDANKLAKNLPNLIQNVLVPYEKTNHLDPFIGTKSQELFTDPALRLIKKYNNR